VGKWGRNLQTKTIKRGGGSTIAIEVQLREDDSYSKPKKKTGIVIRKKQNRGVKKKGGCHGWGKKGWVVIENSNLQSKEEAEGKGGQGNLAQ